MVGRQLEEQEAAKQPRAEKPVVELTTHRVLGTSVPDEVVVTARFGRRHVKLMKAKSLAAKEKQAVRTDEIRQALDRLVEETLNHSSEELKTASTNSSRPK